MLQWFHHNLMNDSGFSLAPIFTFWLSLHTVLWAMFSPNSFKVWLHSNPMNREESLFLSRMIFQLMLFIKKKKRQKKKDQTNQTQYNKSLFNLKPSFPQGCMIILMGELHTKNLVLMKVPSNILLQRFLVWCTENFSSRVISLGCFLSLQRTSFLISHPI